MANLIYQYWDGPLLPGVLAGSNAMKAYAKRVGIGYVFEHNPKWQSGLGRFTIHYGSFKPVFEAGYGIFDKILFVDTDVFPVEGLEENIFHAHRNISGIGVCQEEFQPLHRTKVSGDINSKNDEIWAAAVEKRYGGKVPRTEDGLIKVYNSGVVLYGWSARAIAEKHFDKFIDYVRYIQQQGLPAFYTSDQCFLHAMITKEDVMAFEMDTSWNTPIHYVDGKVNDLRTPDTKFVHIQLSSADHYDEEILLKIVNLPESEWGLKEYIAKRQGK